MIREYIIVKGSELGIFVAEVNKLIVKGFEPIGGVAVNETGLYLQAMIKQIVF